MAPVYEADRGEWEVGPATRTAVKILERILHRQLRCALDWIRIRKIIAGVRVDAVHRSESRLARESKGNGA